MGEIVTPVSDRDDIYMLGDGKLKAVDDIYSFLKASCSLPHGRTSFMKRCLEHGGKHLMSQNRNTVNYKPLIRHGDCNVTET